eukprot:3757494-Rhodomonas_salina.1
MPWDAHVWQGRVNLGRFSPKDERCFALDDRWLFPLAKPDAGVGYAVIDWTCTAEGHDEREAQAQLQCGGRGKETSFGVELSKRHIVQR